MTWTDKDRSNARLVAVINGFILVIASPIIALTMFEQTDSWSGIGLAMFTLAAMGGGGALSVWWGLRK